MKVLFADSDRDLLSCYQRLMSAERYEADTVFDGTQVLERLKSGAYDLAVLNERLPMASHGHLMARLYENRVPVIVLLYGSIDTRCLCQRDLANAYLSFPFSPADFFGLVRNVTEKCQTGEATDFRGIPVDVGGFRFSGTDVRLTADEIDLLAQLSGGAVRLPFQRRVYVHALNLKLQQAGVSPLRIAYQEGRGYGLVNTSEVSVHE